MPDFPVVVVVSNAEGSAAATAVITVVESDSALSGIMKQNISASMAPPTAYSIGYWAPDLRRPGAWSLHNRHDEQC